MDLVLSNFDSSDLSIVVQGAIDKNATAQCLQSLRSTFPKAEIILSTWKGSVFDGLDYDQLLLNTDPGGLKDPFNGVTVNLNRQLASTLNGIIKASRKYVLKTRSDLKFKSSDFFNFWNSFNSRDEKVRIFEHKILMSSFFCKKFIGLHDRMPVPFHIGDWVLFGTKTDMLRLWEISQAIEPNFTNYFWMSNYRGIKFDAFKASHKLAPEQYILLESIRKNLGIIPMENYLDYNQQNINLSHSIMMSNFIFLDPPQWSFESLKQQYSRWTIDLDSLPGELRQGLYLHNSFKADYQEMFATKVV